MDMTVKPENVYVVPPKKPKMEWDIKDQFDVKPKFEADINIKIEPIKEFNRSMEIITKMNVPVNIEIKNKKIELQIEMDIKPKIEPIDDINRGMEIIDNMSIPIKAEIQNENLEKYKCSICNWNLVEFSTRRLLIQHMLTLHIHKHKCIICKEKMFPTNESLIEHMSSVHKKNIARKKKCDNWVLVKMSK